MIADRIGHRSRQLLAERIVAAHHALQLGEFAHHAAHQVGLAEPRRLGDLSDVGSRHELRDLCGKCGDALDALGLGAELGVEHDVPQRRQPVFQSCFAVLIPEEFRVGKARAQHALIALDNGLAAVAGHIVGDDDEAVRERAVRLRGREIALMGPHGNDQHLGRQLQELPVDGAEQRHRPFDQARHFFEQAVIVLERHLRASTQPTRILQDDPFALSSI